MGLDLRISESICGKNYETVKIAKWLQDEGHIHKHYTRNGFVKIIERDGDNPVRISHPKLLRQRYDGIPTF